MAGCLLQQAGAKLFETQSVFGSQITIRFLVSPRLSPPGSAACVAGMKEEEGGKKKEEREREERKKEAGGWSSISTASWRRINTHQVQEAPVGSLQGAAHCKK